MYSSSILTWQSRKSCAVVDQVHSWELWLVIRLFSVRADVSSSVVEYLDVTVEEKLRSGWSGPFVRVVISNSFAFSASRCLKFSCRVFRRDKPGNAAQWLVWSIRESWGALWLVIRLLSVRAYVSSSVVEYLDATSLIMLRSGWSGPFVKVEGRCD
jgi:hypothetical protein